MISRFDKSIIKKYGEEKLRDICNANMKLVPENIITAMKASISLESFPADKDSCHRFLGWDVEKFAYHRSQGIPLNILFDNMKIHQPSCTTICINPDHHFHEFSSENRCFPLEKVFNVFRRISNNAANKLLDESLIDAIFKQIQTKEIKKQLNVFQIPKPSKKKYTLFQRRADFKVLLINFDILKLDDDDGILQNEDYKILYNNLIDNLHPNFDYTLLTKPFGENTVIWEKHVNNFTNNVNIFIVLLSKQILKNIDKWKINAKTSDTDSLNSHLNIDETFDRVFKFQDFVWKKLSSSDALKVAVTFDEVLISSVSRYFPIAYVLPKEMHTLLCFIDKIRKTNC